MATPPTPASRKMRLSIALMTLVAGSAFLVAYVASRSSKNGTPKSPLAAADSRGTRTSVATMNQPAVPVPQKSVPENGKVADLNSLLEQAEELAREISKQKEDFVAASTDGNVRRLAGLHQFALGERARFAQSHEQFLAWCESNGEAGRLMQGILSRLAFAIGNAERMERHERTLGNAGHKQMAKRLERMPSMTWAEFRDSQIQHWPDELKTKGVRESADMTELSRETERRAFEIAAGKGIDGTVFDEAVSHAVWSSEADVFYSTIDSLLPDEVQNMIERRRRLLIQYENGTQVGRR